MVAEALPSPEDRLETRLEAAARAQVIGDRRVGAGPVALEIRHAARGEGLPHGVGRQAAGRRRQTGTCTKTR